MRSLYSRFILKEAARIKYAGVKERDKLEYAFTAGTHKYYRYTDDLMIPLKRYEQTNIILLEINSRISRKDLLDWCETMSNLLEKNNKKHAIAEIGHLVGELKDRLNILFEPNLLISLVSALMIRQDQLGNEHLWSQEIEDDKIAEILYACKDGGVADFFYKKGLGKFLPSTNLSQKDLEAMIQSQMGIVKGFSKLMKAKSGKKPTGFSEQKSTTT